MEDTLKDVLADWHKKALPANYVMLDSWWYQKDGDPPPSDPGHTNVSWPVRSVGGVIEWVPEPNVFPSQLAHGDPFGLPTFLHNRAFSENNTYRRLPQFANGTFVGCDSGVCLPVDEALFGHILDVMAPYRPFVYEQDWISKVYGSNSAVYSDITTGARWLDAMNDAAAKRSMSIQFSMSFGAAIMHSSTMPALTQIRGSGDYVCGGDQWKIGDTSMLYWALGAVASKDTFWTTKHQPGCPKAGSFNCTEPNVELQLVTAALSWGPVGPGDRLGLTDVPLTMRSCDTTGRLLRPDRPHAPLDLTFEHLAASGHSSHVQLWSSYTDRRAELSFEAELISPVWHYVIAADTFPADGINVYPADLLVNASGSAGGSGSSFAAVPIVATGGAWPAMAVGESVRSDIDNATPLNLNPPGQTPIPPPSPGPPSFPCTSPSGSATEYCEHDGFYCGGAERVLAHEGGEELAACKALCDADANCNCVSHGTKAGQNCRVYHGASELIHSNSGYSAFVKPDFVHEPATAVEPAALAAAPVTAFEYWLLAPRLRSGFAIVGDLSKAVPASRQRLCAMSSSATTVFVTLCGGVAESVTMAYVAPGDRKLAAVACTLGTGGRASVQCTVSTRTCRC